MANITRLVTAALPGLKAEDVSITGQTLSIRGEFKADEKVKRDEYVPVRGDAATATIEDGVLTLTIPKAEEVKPRQIEVKPAHKQVESSTSGRQAA